MRTRFEYLCYLSVYEQILSKNEFRNIVTYKLFIY